MDDLANVPPLGPTTVAIFVAFASFVAILTRARPLTALGVLALTIPFAFTHRVGATTVDTSKMALVGAFVSLLLAGPWDLVPRSRAERALVGLSLAFGLLETVRIGAATYHGPALREALKAGEYLATFVSAGALVKRARRLGENGADATWAMTLASLATLVSASALLDLVFRNGSVFTLGGALVRRAAGALEGPNQLAGYLDLLIPPLVATSLAATNRGPFVAIGLGLAAIAEVATFSRAGIVAAIAGVAVVAIAARSVVGVRSRSALIGAAVLVAAAALGIVLRGGVQTVDERLDGLATRGELWHAAIVLWHRNPVVGIGPGNFEFSLDSVGLLGVRTHANNYYLQTLAENGVVGLALAIAILAVAIVGLVRPPSRSWSAIGTAAATLALALHQTLDDLVFFPKVGETWWLLLGVAFALAYPDRPARTRASSATASSSTALV